MKPTVDVYRKLQKHLDNMRQVSPAVRIPMAIPYMAVPVGATLILIDALFMLLLPQNALLKTPAEYELL